MAYSDRTTQPTGPRNHLASKGSGSGNPGAAGRQTKSHPYAAPALEELRGWQPVGPSLQAAPQAGTNRLQGGVSQPLPTERGYGIQAGLRGSNPNTDRYGNPTRYSLSNALPLAGMGNVAGWTGTGWQPRNNANSVAGAGAGNSAFSFDAAANATAANQNDIRGLLMNGAPGISQRFLQSPQGRAALARLANPQGMDPEALAAQRRMIDQRAATQSNAQQSRLSNALARSGMGASGAAAWGREQLAGDIAAQEMGQQDALTIENANMRRADEAQYLQAVMGMMGMEQSAISDAANQIGQFQFPFLPPDATGGSSAGGWGSGGGTGSGSGGLTGGAAAGGGWSNGNMGGNDFAYRGSDVLPTNSGGFLPGALPVIGGGLGSQRQLNTVLGNERYRAMTGQDHARDWLGRRVYGYSF